MSAPDKLVLCSGGFDPLHVGHLEYLQRAAKLGRVVVALNSDTWLQRKKGYAFMRYEERARILEALDCVFAVIAADDADDTVCKTIETVRPTIFAKGGDRTADNTPEMEICGKLGVDMVFGLGAKVQASSELVRRAWGHYEVLADRPGYKVKILTLLPGQSTSVQHHNKRNEHWVYPHDNTYEFIRVGEVHQCRNTGSTPLEIVEVQTGNCEEDDIVRY